MDDYLLTAAADRVVVLNRRNVLQRIVSTHMSEQSHIWQVWMHESRAKFEKHRYEPLEKAAIARDLAAEREATEVILKRLDHSGVPHISVWYEDIFAAPSVQQRILAFGNVIAFITGRPFEEKLLKREALPILDPVESKMNSAETYELVPEIHEIDRLFGSNETGYLFR